MTRTVTIVDYGSGNLLSVMRAVEHEGGSPVLSHDPEEILTSERLILPGVGAFGDGMRGLNANGLVGPIQAFAASGRPLLGICLGMQMLATKGTEFGEHDGLGIIPGVIEGIPTVSAAGLPVKVPHIGWTELAAPSGRSWSGTVLEGFPPHGSCYLVHSYQFIPDDPTDLLATCTYEGNTITAAVQRGNVVGCQFHPEKSSEAGLAIVSAFLDR